MEDSLVQLTLPANLIALSLITSVGTIAHGLKAEALSKIAFLY